MGREVEGRSDFRMKAVKWVVAKLQGDITVYFCRKMSARGSCREINQHPSLPWNFMTHGFLNPFPFPDGRVLRRFFKDRCFLEGFLEGACKSLVQTNFLERFIEGSVS